MFKLVVNIKPRYIQLVQNYQKNKKWEELQCFTTWYQHLFRESMYYLNGAHIYFDDFTSSELTGYQFTAMHPNIDFIQSFICLVLSEIGSSPPVVTSEIEEKKIDEYKMNMCLSTIKCFLHDVKFDMLKFATWYLTLDQAHINSMKKDEKLITATLNYANSYKTFFSP